MKTFLWKLKYTWIMKFYADTSFKFAWDCAESWVESFGIEDSTPREAVYEEVSNWGDCVDGYA